MPLNKINYENTCFYKIVCKDLAVSDLYVGHTTDFVNRKSEHKRNATNSRRRAFNYPLYKFIRDDGEWDNFDMILIDRCKCVDALDARKKEREYIELLNATLNSHIPNRTKTEYYVDRREYTLNKVKEYYEQNTKKCKEWKNDVKKCECGFTYTNANKARHERSLIHKNYFTSLSEND